MEEVYNVIIVECVRGCDSWTSVLGIFDDDHLDEAIEFHEKIYSNKNIDYYKIRVANNFEINSFYAV